MSRKYTNVLLITANVGSIFEDPKHMLPLWLKEFTSTVKRLDPDFVAVHCQEVGGKNYEESMQHVNEFIKALLSSENMQQFDKAKFFLDEDFTAAAKFTALGNLYFINNNQHNVQIFDFIQRKFVPVTGKEVHSGNIENEPTKEKSKFPQDFFPEHKWSRKGFIRTRWSINNSVFDLVNIHLFHDASNIIAMETSPSSFSGNRQRAFAYTLKRFETDDMEKVPQFIFGDFNFRLDTHRLVKKLTAKTTSHQLKGKKNDISKIVFTEQTNGKTVLTIEKKGFDHHDRHSEVFSNNNGKWLHDYDTEVDPFRDRIFEYEITFPPSYPFSEDVNDGMSYMKTRVPSWCDRVVLGHSAKDLIYQDASGTKPDYNIIGPNICMGDHKPIYLHFRLKNGTGNDPADSDADDVSKPPLRKVISINGEKLETPDLSDINIHDYATFEKEEHLPPSFFSGIRQKPSLDENGVARKRSFSKLARSVVQAEGVMIAFRRFRRHSSSSESSDENELQNNNSLSLEIKATEQIEAQILPAGDTKLDNNNTAEISTKKIERSDDINIDKTVQGDVVLNGQTMTSKDVGTLPVSESGSISQSVDESNSPPSVSTNQQVVLEMEGDKNTNEAQSSKGEVTVVTNLPPGQRSQPKRASSVRELAQRSGCPCSCIVM